MFSREGFLLAAWRGKSMGQLIFVFKREEPRFNENCTSWQLKSICTVKEELCFEISAAIMRVFI